MAAFTTIAVGVGLAATAASTGMSFANAGKQKKLAAEAKADADASMQKARKALEINFYEQQAINKQPYELEREALLSSSAQAMDAAREAGLAPLSATAGRVQMAMNEAQAGVTSRMSKEMTDIDKSIIDEDTRLRDTGINIDLAEAQGAQLAARDAQEASALATQQGMEGVTSMVSQAASLVPLFSQNISAQRDAAGKMNMSQEDFAKFGQVRGKDGGISQTMGAVGKDGFTNLDFDAIKNMSDSQFRTFKKELTPEQNRMLFQNEQYTNNYNPFRY